MSATATLDQYCVPEPKWILDRQESGQGELFWRREAAPANKSRVRFRFDVEIKEFSRQAYEFTDPDYLLQSYYLEEATERFTMGITCLVCMAVTVLLPWYIIGA